jgi:hypothetical protein
MMEPIVRLMVPCEDARPRKGRSKKTDIFGVTSTITAPADAFPIRHTFAVYLALTNGHGRGHGTIVIKDEDTNEIVYPGLAHPFDFGNDPISVVGYVIRIPSCELPKPGLYRIEFVYNSSAVLEKCYLQVRETP